MSIPKILRKSMLIYGSDLSIWIIILITLIIRWHKPLPLSPQILDQANGAYHVFIPFASSYNFFLLIIILTIGIIQLLALNDSRKKRLRAMHNETFDESDERDRTLKNTVYRQLHLTSVTIGSFIAIYFSIQNNLIISSYFIICTFCVYMIFRDILLIKETFKRYPLWNKN